MNATLQAAAQTVTGTLTVAAFPSAARGVLPSAMSRLQGHWPQLELRLLEVTSHRAVDLVASGGADLAVAHDWIGVTMDVPTDVLTRHLGDDVSDVLVCTSHPMASSIEVALQDFVDDPWLFEPGSVAHEFLLHAFREVPNRVSLGHMIGEYATQVEMVGAGLGVVLAPRMGRGLLPNTVRAVTVRSPPLRRVFGAWRSSSDGRPAIEAALTELEAACHRPAGQPR